MSDERDRDDQVEPAVDPEEFRRRRMGDGSAMTPRHEGGQQHPPETAAITHGGHMQGPLHCDACAIRGTCPEHRPGSTCALDERCEQHRRRLIAGALVELGHNAELHGSLIENAVLCRVMVERMCRYLGARGDIIPAEFARGIVVEQPGARHLLKLMTQEERALERMGLTPQALDARAANQPAGGMGSVVAQAHSAPAAAAPEEIVDAEFTEGDGDGAPPPNPPLPGAVDDTAQAGEGGLTADGDDGTEGDPGE